MGCADECAYAPRDRQVKVSEKYEQPRKRRGDNSGKAFAAHQSNRSANWNASSYLDQLLAENRRLKEQSVTSADAAEVNDPPNTER